VDRYTLIRTRPSTGGRTIVTISSKAGWFDRWFRGQKTTTREFRGSGTFWYHYPSSLRCDEITEAMIVEVLKYNEIRT
jgi:hypothetical protein